MAAGRRTMSDGGSVDLALYAEDRAGGGMQEVFHRLATALSARGRRVELWVTSLERGSTRPVPAGVSVVHVPGSSRLRTAAALARVRLPRAMPPALLATLTHRDDAAFLQLDGLASRLAERRPRILLAATPYRNLEALLARALVRDPPRLFVSEHNDLRSGHPLGAGRHRAILDRLARELYPAADGIIAVSQGVAEDVARRSGLPLERIRVIYNPAVTPDMPSRAAEPVAHPWLRAGEPPVVLAVGRLGAAKDLPMLVRAFARLRARRPARLVVLGTARRPESTARRIAFLERLAGELGVAGDVAFPGYAKNPFAWMARAGVLAVTSRNEGFCNVIAEALGCGCPVVSTDCPSGPAEILDRGRYGRLVAVGDDVAMAAALEATLDAPRDADRLRARADCFTVDRAIEGYERLLWPDEARSETAESAHRAR